LLSCGSTHRSVQRANQIVLHLSRFLATAT
jgi:hypothetical protein